jgi:hypothetical protein
MTTMSRSHWPPPCWDCGFESRRGHGCLSLLSVVCWKVWVSASGWSLVQRSPIEYGVSECDRKASIMRRPWHTGGCCSTEKQRALCLVMLCSYSGSPFFLKPHDCTTWIYSGLLRRLIFLHLLVSSNPFALRGSRSTHCQPFYTQFYRHAIWYSRMHGNETCEPKF